MRAAIVLGVAPALVAAGSIASCVKKTTSMMTSVVPGGYGSQPAMSPSSSVTSAAQPASSTPQPISYGSPPPSYGSQPAVSSSQPAPPVYQSSSCPAVTVTVGPMYSTPTTCSATYSPAYSTYHYDQLTTDRYATPLPSPFVVSSSYAPAFAQASTLLPSNATTTSYSLNPAATATPDGQYGQSAYAALWATYSYNTTIPFSTTVSPTPVASSELVFPPALYTPCPDSADTCLDCYKVPKDFKWGVAGSAIQIEGALMKEGRGPSALDSLGALPDPGDSVSFAVTDMNYYLYKQDIARLAAIGIPYYSFSVSWTRIVPFGTAGSPINQPGLDHYEDVINTCLQYGIQPIVTLTHFDYPAGFSFANDTFPDDFLYYAKQVMTRFADRVSDWVTINEPNLAFGNGPTNVPYAKVPNLLMAHAKVYHFYKEELKGTGKITLKLANNLAIPLTNSTDDVRAAARYQDFIVRIIGNPIFLGQQYPAEVLSTPNLNVTALSDEDLAYINGTADYLSIDPYTAGFGTSPPGETIDQCANNMSDPLYPVCAFTTNVQANGWLNGQGSFAYAYIAPQYVRQQMGYLWNTFKPKGILVAEFGFNPYMEYSKTVVAQLYDLERTLYYQWFLRELLKAMYIDNVVIVGTLGWSFLDNDEFGSVQQQYGMQHVNRTNGLFTRSYKRSMFDYVDFFHQYLEK